MQRGEVGDAGCQCGGDPGMLTRYGSESESESTQENCVSALDSLSLRFKGLARAAGVAEVLREVEERGSERAREKARNMLLARAGREIEVNIDTTFLTFLTSDQLTSQIVRLPGWKLVLWSSRCGGSCVLSIGGEALGGASSLLAASYIAVDEIMVRIRIRGFMIFCSIEMYTVVQTNAVAAMVNLSLEKVNKLKIVRSRIAPSLIDVLKGGGAEWQEHASGAIFSLALEDDNRTAIGVLGALQPHSFSTLFWFQKLK
ncbi:RING/U-box superfamily protein with ARM repeat domain-containing protein [Actinidia rufa]|uniref:RING/U-box superfamily protein with ARM repeat domain-containing protein n=1 Tax=Actinidia rufa TaxID=165716 RepID=A0A7J0F5L2_9ERIC|nr:RING/U-box superfamily protein with ARM repeat domain-containing protein [Actinidia rufa]